MPIFVYLARNRQNALEQGNLDAADEKAAVLQLQARGLTIVRLATAGQEFQKPKGSGGMHKRIRSEDLLFFVSQTAELLDAGVPLLRSLEIIHSLIKSSALKKILREMIDNIRAGSTFSDSLARHPKHFPVYWPSLIEAGEASGNLSSIMHELARNLEASSNLKTKIVSALIYPAILVVGSVVAVLVFVLKIIPVFNNLFKTFNAKLPPLTQGVLSLSEFMNHYFLFIMGTLAALVYFLNIYFSTNQGRRVMDRLLLSIPVFGAFISDIIHARVAIVLATLTKSGLNLLKSIEITARVAGSSLFQSALEVVSKEIQQGRSFSGCLRANPLFAPMFVELTAVGEESGKLPEMIGKAAKFYQNRVDIFASRIGTLVEPIILIFVGSIVGVLVIALFLPILTLSQAIH